MAYKPLSHSQLEYFVSLLERGGTSKELRSLAETLVTLYFQEGPDAAGKEWLRLRARSDIEAFSEYVFDFVPDTHHKFFLRALTDPDRKRIVVVAPPASAKSVYFSQIYPLFETGRNPDGAIIMLTEAFSQAERFNSQHRPILRGDGDVGKRYLEVFPEVVADESNFTKEKVYVANRAVSNVHPSIFYTGITSNAVQGARATTILLDDVVGPDKVRSPTEMTKVRENITSLIMPRLLPSGKVTVVCTRWAESDLVDLFLNELDFEMLFMPALSDDPRGAYVETIPSKAYLRYPKPGEKSKNPQWVRHEDPESHLQSQLDKYLKEAKDMGLEAEVSTSRPNYDLPCVRTFIHPDRDPVLWPQFVTAEALRQRQATNPISFRLVYNGDPTGVKGDVFRREWFHTYGGEGDVFRHVPPDCRYFMSVDVAVGGSRKGRGDYFVCLVVAVDPRGNKFIVDCMRSKTLLPPEQRAALIRLYRDVYPQTQAILIEATNYQSALVYELQAANLPVVGYRPTKNKDVRIESSTVYWAQNNIFLPHHASWVGDFVDEHTQYPRGKHDDQIDAGAQLWEYLSVVNRNSNEYEISFG